MAEKCTLDDVGDIIGDETSRQILQQTKRDGHSAEALSNDCNTSKPTIYRRLDRLRRCDVLIEQTRLDTEAGHHYTVYATDLERIVIDVDPEGLSVEFEHEEDMADRFTRLVEGM